MRNLCAFVAITALAAAACESERPGPTGIDDVVEADLAATRGSGAGGVAATNIVDLANSLLEAQGAEYRVAYAEYVTTPGMAASQNIILARDVGLQRLPDHFIPDDPRRGGLDGDPNTIDVIIDQVDGATSNGLTEPTTTAAIARAMGTWDARTCSDLGMNMLAAPVDLGLIQAALGFGGGVAVSDIMHAGWLPGAFFDLVQPNGSTFILGVTFTLSFVPALGDLDGDGMPDVGAREIYYNDAFAWADDGVTMVDVETVALHEAGHGLSQGHFGKIFINPNSGKAVFSPLAVMNAGIAFPNRDLDGSDVGGHCATWGNWPNN